MELDGWSDFGVAVTGASGALVGLLFVAMSINLRQIVGSAQLPGRAILALLLLVVPMFSAMVLLMPQPVSALGVELLVIGVLGGASLGWQVRPGTRSDQQPRTAWLLGTVLPAAVVAVGTVAGGALLVAGHPAGAYGVAVATIAAFTGALLTTWVLLVEILR